MGLRVTEQEVFGGYALLSDRTVIAGLALGSIMFLGSYMGKRVLNKLPENIFPYIIDGVLHGHQHLSPLPQVRLAPKLRQVLNHLPGGLCRIDSRHSQARQPVLQNSLLTTVLLVIDRLSR